MDKKYLNFIIAAVCGLAAIFLINAHNRQKEAAMLAQRPPEIKILIAAKDIKHGTVITVDMLAFRHIPKAYAEPKAFTSGEPVLGKAAALDILAGEQITQTKLLSPEGLTLAMQTPPGKRAITMTIDAASAVGGMITPGDYVDIVGIFDISADKSAKQAVTLFQKVLVLAVGSETESDLARETKTTAKGGAITLALNPDEVELMLFAQEKGKIRLILRSPSDTNIEPLTKTSEQIKQYIVDLMQKGISAPPEKPARVTPSQKTEEGPKIEIFKGIIKEDTKKR